MEQVTFSNLMIEHCKKHLNIEEDFKEDDSLINLCLYSAKDYVKTYTSLSEEKLDKIPSINIAVLLLVTDMYSKRSATEQVSNKVNFVLKSILDMNRVWL
ncbi:head-tail connector protein [Romboutsia sp. 1001216sp1]|uniref:head-tail connector protein n=1 Tax=unclassified Romboutsia TaxID=2626894 RepID=UPI0018A92E45|nr:MULTISPECIES: head-tail connector protein [unclassified Romboutsia]MDB8794275.1 head-tail connector protein [Romboutsia sp. 1001216sp1]MDB8796444.1 head-tail connector protein [Romboutsia sp. 1001216sp1]MDB8797803.1 head-tail connector protein [Romboutsia sp. 1001216sp1]